MVDLKAHRYYEIKEEVVMSVWHHLIHLVDLHESHYYTRCCSEEYPKMLFSSSLIQLV